MVSREDQLERSRKLQSEGLEGLPDRAKDLLTLGSTFFLSFLPLGAVVAVIFATLAFGLGDSFVRTGGAGPPPYVDPNDLLQPDQAPGAPFVKFRRFDDNYANSFEQEDPAPAAAAENALEAEEDTAGASALAGLQEEGASQRSEPVPAMAEGATVSGSEDK
eukprot:CAMPEP_0197493950 /NCGR_PEP_ID=MMETSP1311-20131121/25751_1 /TAXON_ID=464262 /ORGANISM="Genus nov. species nov., Strain RCC856" /LENGTH=161 /DNA_ID=CAMNT_0043039265 /DNA_START=6 /DNA_END=491 /DNA_ORIENTATION=-